MSLSVRIFGLSTWSILTPQAIMGVATSYLIYKVLRRGFGPRTSLFSAAAYATTPVVVLMSRFNNPEPLMGLLTVASVFVTLKAMESGKSRGFALAGFLLGLGFLAKQVQALLVAPALMTAVLTFGHGRLTQRIRQVTLAAALFVATAGAWLLPVEMIPAALRPYVGGSLTNSAMELTMDYNGLARFIQIPLTIQGGRASAAQDDAAIGDGGLRRLLNENFAPEIVWLLITGMICCVVVLFLNRTLNLGTAQRNVTTVVCVWFTTVLFVLSSMGTMIHTYYTYSLAAPTALVVAIGLSCLWRLRSRVVLRILGSGLVTASAYIALRVMEYSAEWPLWTSLVVGFLGLTGGILWLLPTSSHRVSSAAAAVLLCSFLFAPTCANLFTIGTQQNGTNPQSGPIGKSPTSLSRTMLAIKSGKPQWLQQTAFGAKPSSAVVDILANTSDQQWAAATYSAQNAALYQLESGRPVIPLGGWLGTDPAPTLEQFQDLVAEHRIGYFIWQQALLERGELSDQALAITNWVRSNFTDQTVDGVRLYDLSD